MSPLTIWMSVRFLFVADAGAVVVHPSKMLLCRTCRDAFLLTPTVNCSYPSYRRPSVSCNHSGRSPLYRSCLSPLYISPLHTIQHFFHCGVERGTGADADGNTERTFTAEVIKRLCNAAVFCLSHCDVCVSEGSGPRQVSHCWITWCGLALQEDPLH